MKKLLAVAFVASLTIVSCGNKTDDGVESNVMLPEPKVETMDSTATAKPTDGVVVATDSTTIKVDSAK